MPDYSNYGLTEKGKSMQRVKAWVPSREELDAERAYDPTENWDWQNEQQLGPQGEELPVLATGWRPDGRADFGGGLGGWAKKAMSNIQTSYWTGYDEGIQISKARGWITEKVQGVEVAEETLAEVEKRRRPQNKQMAYFAGAVEATKEIFDQALWGALEGLAQPSYWLEQGLGAIGYSISDIQKGKDPNWERNWKAGRLAYSSVFYESIRAEMERNLDAGMRPEIAAEEIMARSQEEGRKGMLWAEIGGQVVLDPLWLIGKIGKAIKGGKTLAGGKATYAVAQNADVATAFQKTASMTDEIQIAKTLTGTQASHAKTVRDVKNGIGVTKKGFRPGGLTAGGKINHLENMTSEILHHVVNNSDDPVEVLRGMVQFAGDDVAEAERGLATIMSFADPQALVSEAGNTTTALMSHLDDGKWLDDIAKAGKKGGDPEIAEMIFSKMQKAGEEMYPSVEKMLEAKKAVKAGSDSKRLVALADQLDNVPRWVQSVAKKHTLAQKAVAPANKFFANVYMGWSPGYAIRNYSNNVLTMLTDHGVGLLVGNVDDAIAKAQKLHGGKLAGQYGIGQAGALSKKARGGAPILKWAEKIETNHAKRIIAATYTKEFNRGIGALVKSVAPDLKAAGFSDDVIRSLPTYIEVNGGDYKKVIAAIHDDLGKGAKSLFQDTSRIDPKFRGFLEKSGKWDNYLNDVLYADTSDEAMEAATKIFDDLDEAAQLEAKTHGIGTNVQHADNQRIVAEGVIGRGTGDLMDRRINANNGLSETISNTMASVDQAVVDFAAKTGESIPVEKWKSGLGLTPEGVRRWGTTAFDEHSRLRELAWEANDAIKAKGDFKEIWNKYTDFFDGPAPEVLYKEQMLDRLWQTKIKKSNDVFIKDRDRLFGAFEKYIDSVGGAGVQVDKAVLQKVDEIYKYAQELDTALVGKDGFPVIDEVLEYGTRSTRISAMASKAGIVPGATKTGAKLDEYVLRTINKYGGPDVNYKSLEEIPIEFAAEALTNKKSSDVVEAARKAGGLAEDIGDISKADEVVETVSKLGERIDPIMSADGTPSMSHALYEQRKGAKAVRTWMEADIAENFGRKQVVNPVGRKAMNNLEKIMKKRIAETRLISSRVAQANRDFTLLNYGKKTYWDVGLAYLYPYHFWYSGTYKNWLSRVATTPAVISGYAKYKDNLAAVHADLPEWWKYNINTNDIPGIDMDNPLYANLEATLWPLNGLTNVDFNDRNKRVNAWTYGLDFMNRFGPSTWSPINMATGLALQKQGETEAGDRWMGRLFPQTKAIKAGASLLGLANNLELDPFVSFLQDDLDPYERRRVGLAFTAMEQEGYSEEELLDAAHSHEGPVWDEAVKRAIHKRAPADLASYTLGVGFKARTEQDMAVDRFYNDYFRMWNVEPNLTKEEFREAFDTLREKYPFMDAVLLSRKGGVDRDKGLAYNVLSRIPPAQADDIAKAAGISPELLSKFFDDKGRIENWSDGDRKRFMAGVMDIAAVLEVPSDMTRREWTAARNANSAMETQAKELFGDDILENRDHFYELNATDKDKAQDFLDNSPQTERFMEWRKERILMSPLLNAYYGGAEVLNKYMRGQMYEAIEEELGPEIFDITDEYQQVKTYGTKQDNRAFWNEHGKTMRRYWKLKYDVWQPMINKRVAEFGASNLPEGKGAQIREDFDVTSLGGQQLAQAIQPEQRMTIEDWQRIMPPELFRVVADFHLTGEEIPREAENILERINYDLGYEYVDDLIQDFGISLLSGR